MDFGELETNNRLVELRDKRNRGEVLTEYEDAELIGLFAFPDNSDGAKLRALQVLTEKGLAVMNDEQREALRRCFQQKFASVDNELRETSPRKPSSPASSNTSSLEFDVLCTKAKIAGLENNWNQRPAINVVEEMLSALPDDVHVYSRDELGKMPKNEPSPLELFLLSKIGNLGDFKDVKQGSGALRVTESIHCIRDAVRTKKFLTAVKEVVQKLEKNKEVIRVLDAGCGAIPIQAIFAALVSEKCQCTCLELNPHSAKIAKEVVKALGLEKQIHVLEANAIEFQPSEKADVLISETMHSGLSEEPIVQIMDNLCKHVAGGGEVLPSHIRVHAALMPLTDYASPDGFVKINQNMHHHVSPQWQTYVDYVPGTPLQKIDFTIPTTGLKPGMYFVLLNSDVEIGHQHLTPYQSLITMPQVVRSNKEDPWVCDVTEKSTGVHVSYTPGSPLEGVAKVINN